jgi:hypothetical protein
MWSPNPHPKTLVECAVCHTQAATGNYRIKNYSVTDERFRPRDEDWR